MIDSTAKMMVGNTMIYHNKNCTNTVLAHAAPRRGDRGGRDGFRSTRGGNGRLSTGVDLYVTSCPSRILEYL